MLMFDWTQDTTSPVSKKFQKLFSETLCPTPLFGRDPVFLPSTIESLLIPSSDNLSRCRVDSTQDFGPLGSVRVYTRVGSFDTVVSVPSLYVPRPSPLVVYQLSRPSVPCTALTSDLSTRDSGLVLLGPIQE